MITSDAFDFALLMLVQTIKSVILTYELGNMVVVGLLE